MRIIFSPFSIFEQVCFRHVSRGTKWRRDGEKRWQNKRSLRNDRRTKKEELQTRNALGRSLRDMSPLILMQLKITNISQLAFYVNLHRAVIGPSATLTGRWRPDIDLRRMLTRYMFDLQGPLPHLCNITMKHKTKTTTQLAFYVNLHQAVIGPSATLTGRWRPEIDLRRMLTGMFDL